MLFCGRDASKRLLKLPLVRYVHGSGSRINGWSTLRAGKAQRRFLSSSGQAAGTSETRTRTVDKLGIAIFGSLVILLPFSALLAFFYF